jgi:hypothetical protein
LKKENSGKPAATLMIEPYARIIPMHLTIIFCGLLGNFVAIASIPSIVNGNFQAVSMSTGLPIAAIILFILLKTFADVVMHINEHKEQMQENAI